jgi:hypothetical protein
VPALRTAFSRRHGDGDADACEVCGDDVSERALSLVLAAPVEHRVPTRRPCELACGVEIRTIEWVAASCREAGNRGRDDAIGGRVAERRRQRAPVDRVIHGATQPRVPEHGTVRVEDDVVDERRRVQEVLLSTRSCRGAALAGAARERAARVEERRRVVEVLWQQVEGSRVRERDGARRRNVVRVDDPLGTPGTASVVVRIAQQDGSVAFAGGDVVRAGGGKGARRVRVRGDRRRNRAERRHRNPRQKISRRPH